mmetsp:Transcript_78045/g.207107  ORF Transcript_78045/g.207107 Transcript_78045/m.207107 type:complete len:244 (+) Transcript_78045:132-863(+)
MRKTSTTSSTMTSSIQAASTLHGTCSGSSSSTAFSTSSSGNNIWKDQRMSQARPADPTERTAPILACPWRPGSTKASPVMKSATVRPMPPSAPMAKRSPVVTPVGSLKPMADAKSANPEMPRVLPMIIAMTIDTVMVPKLLNWTPALARPKKNMPISTGSLRFCSKVCNGASSILLNSATTLATMLALLRNSMALATSSTTSLAGPVSTAPMLRTEVPRRKAIEAGMKGTTNTRASAGCTCAL